MLSYSFDKVSPERGDVSVADRGVNFYKSVHMGLCPLTPPLLKKWTKLLIVIAEPLINNPNEVSHKSFCQTFFKKFVGFSRAKPLKQDF